MNLDANALIDKHAFVVDTREDTNLATSRGERIHRSLNAPEISKAVGAIADSVCATTFQSRQWQERGPAIVFNC